MSTPQKTKIKMIGNGSLGGKAEGIMRLAEMLDANQALSREFNSVELKIPETLVITTELFDAFLEKNHLDLDTCQVLSDQKIAEAFLEGSFSKKLEAKLAVYLTDVRYPLAVRSSSLLEDARYQAYAGLYNTYMLPNDHPDLNVRLAHLIEAVKLIYASTFFGDPRSFSHRVGCNVHEEKMAVIVQRAAGRRYGNYFFPAISGVAQSYNYYPFGHMKAKEGTATIAMGFGNIVAEGERALRFSPQFPQNPPQGNNVADILKNAQRYFYSIKLEQKCPPLGLKENSSLIRREVTDLENAPPMHALASTFVVEEQRIRDSITYPGPKVLTFNTILKLDQFPLAPIVVELLKLGQKELGCQVEIEFSVDLSPQPAQSKSKFVLLQMRPMSAMRDHCEVRISKAERGRAFCRSSLALGNAYDQSMRDIILVATDQLNPKHAHKMVQEIRLVNAGLIKENRKYLLIGPGRWGSRDHWLGIPVDWQDISGVGAIVEVNSRELAAEPSQGSHFFHNISTLGINYITVDEQPENDLDWDWLMSQSAARIGDFVRHIAFESPMTLKVDGRTNECVIYIKAENLPV